MLSRRALVVLAVAGASVGGLLFSAADANAVKFGRSKADKVRYRSERDAATRSLDGHKLDGDKPHLDTPCSVRDRMSRPVKRSLTLHGHRTSVSLEDEFWRAFRHIAEQQNKPINGLAAEIDADRDPDTGLASAIRLHVLRHYRDRPDPGPDDQ